MTTNPKIRKAPAAKSKQREKRHLCTITEAAELDWPQSSVINLPTDIISIEKFNNPHLVNVRIVFIMLAKTKPEIMAMWGGDGEDTMMMLAEKLMETKEFFDKLSRLLDTAQMRVIIAGVSVAEAA